ncbi:MAG: ATP-binding cassette domain-containing protein [Gammaproteobacteria bacterium]|nr:ATP-binding cassette domain-containing protein [Gammaproteobacteria bacterium]
MSDTALIRVEHVWRYYSTLCALQDVSFEVRRGEVLGFLGPNGAGKSTTMQIISGNLAPTRGRVWINGIDILDEPRRAKAHIGFLPELPPLYRELTVDEYLQYCARLHHIPRPRERAALDTAKQRCGLAAVGRRLVGNLSKGYRQRVGIAQAILHMPAVVILDEPTAGLDPNQIHEMRLLIRELSAEHSVILSTHILPEVQAVCDQVQIIHRGELVLKDSIEGLERRMQGASLRIGLRHPPTLSVLEAIAGVQGAELLEDGAVRLHCNGREVAEVLAMQAAEQGWGLYELSPERLSLEQVFMELTRSEQAA